MRAGYNIFSGSTFRRGGSYTLMTPKISVSFRANLVGSPQNGEPVREGSGSEALGPQLWDLSRRFVSTIDLHCSVDVGSNTGLT